MRIKDINSTNFCAKNFRLPIKTVLKKDGNTVNKQIIVREYDNKNAEKLWYQLLEEKDFDKKMQLLSAMGKYRLVDINQGETIARQIENGKQSLLYNL